MCILTRFIKRGCNSIVIPKGGTIELPGVNAKGPNNNFNFICKWTSATERKYRLKQKNENLSTHTNLRRQYEKKITDILKNKSYHEKQTEGIRVKINFQNSNIALARC